MVNFFKNLRSNKKNKSDKKTTDVKKQDKKPVKSKLKGNKPKSAKLPGNKYKNAIDPKVLLKLLQKNCEERVDPCASIFLEGVLQYLAVEILELSYSKARERTQTEDCLITAEDMRQAIQTDEELSYLIRVGGKDIKGMKGKKGKKEVAPKVPSQLLGAPSVTEFMKIMDTPSMDD